MRDAENRQKDSNRMRTPRNHLSHGSKTVLIRLESGPSLAIADGPRIDHPLEESSCTEIEQTIRSDKRSNLRATCDRTDGSVKFDRFVVAHCHSLSIV